MSIFDQLPTFNERTTDTVSVLELESQAALEFFISSDQYHSIDLPKYFDFTTVLKYAADCIGNKTLEECLNEGSRPEEMQGVNLDIITNKDGRYAIRPLTLSNPFLHYMLIREICNENAWTQITRCFQQFSHPNIKSCSIPRVKVGEKADPFKGATAILNWWNSMEQRSIELSLNYRYMFITDITNCFGQVNTEAIGWALGLKDTPNTTNDNDELSKNIQNYLRAMQQGKNIGIPQGNTIFSFIAEIVLCYSDSLLAQEIAKAQETNKLPKNLEYEILRYVDDYRIFCNDKDALEVISYILQHILERFNFRMNSSKTRTTTDLITDSIKPDKAFYIFNTPIESKQTYTDADGNERRERGYDFDGFQKHLMFIYEFSRRFPNSGQLVTQLEAFSTRINNYLNPQSPLKKEEWADVDLDDNKPTEDTPTADNKVKRHLWENIPVMVAIAVGIAAQNVRAAPSALKVTSQLLADMKDKERMRGIIQMIYKKLHDIPNSAIIQVWLQNITHTSDDWSSGALYDMPLCKLVANQPTTLWNNTWLKPELANKIPIDSIVNREFLTKTGSVIDFNPKRQYDDIVYTL